MSGVRQATSHPTSRVATIRRRHQGDKARRRLRQRWRWVPLSLRLRFAQVRNRLFHQRVLIRLAVVVTVGVGAIFFEAEPSVDGDADVAVPDGHRVLSMPVDELVPLLEPGDAIELYLGTESPGGASAGVDALEDPGLVVSVTESAFSVAVPSRHVRPIAVALREGNVLVVRR